MTEKKSTVKSVRRAENGSRLAAELPRDPATNRFLPRTPKPAGDPPPAPPAPAPVKRPAAPPSAAPAGGGAPAPAPFRGRLLGRHRRKSAS